MHPWRMVPLLALPPLPGVPLLTLVGSASSCITVDDMTVEYIRMDFMSAQVSLVYSN